MKTWEMIKEWHESNLEKEFKCLNPCHGQIEKMVKNFNGQLCWNGRPGSPLVISEDDHEWEEIKKPVPWQEALQAWIDGKEVIREMAGTSCIFSINNSFAVGRNELVNGKWYIE